MARIARPSLLALLLLGAWPAAAQDRDLVGIYFDEAGASAAFETTAPWQEVHAWVVLKGISAPSGVQGIALTGEWEGAEGLGWTSLIGAASFPLPSQPADWTLQAAPPLPQADAVPVVKIWFLVRSPEQVVRLYVGPPPAWTMTPPLQAAVYQANDGTPGTLVPLHPSSGSYDLPVAVVNGPRAPVSEGTWGQVKGIYR